MSFLTRLHTFSSSHTLAARSEVDLFVVLSFEFNVYCCNQFVNAHVNNGTVKKREQRRKEPGRSWESEEYSAGLNSLKAKR